MEGQARVRHILQKHAGSRNPHDRVRNVKSQFNVKVAVTRSLAAAQEKINGKSQ